MSIILIMMKNVINRYFKIPELRYGKFMGIICCVGVVISLCFVGMLLVAASIDESKTRENVYSSEQMLLNEGEYAETVPGVKLYRKDNFTDAMMVGMCAISDSSSLLSKSLHCTTVWTERESNADGFIHYLDNDLDERDCVGHYSRYWLGFQSTLKPLLLWFNLREIRVLNYILMILLTGVSFCLIWRKIALPIALIFLLSLVIVGMPIVPLSLQFSTCFYITLFASVVIFALPRKHLSCYSMPAIFFIIGGLTSFFDFLTTPILTLGIPLALAMLYKNDKYAIQICLLCIGCWFMGYLCVWAEKWVLATAFTEDNVIMDAMDSLLYRTGGVDKYYPAAINYAPFVLLAVSIAVVWYIFRRGGMANNPIDYRFLIILALLPLIWIAAVRQHTLNHYWFVWRIFAVTLFCVFSYLYLTHKQRHHERK